ncbi:MAG: glycosyltransferase [Melioribacteraceae bacterium]
MNNSVLYVGAFDLPDKNAAALRVIGIAKLFEKANYVVSFLGMQYNSHLNFTEIRKIENTNNSLFWHTGKPKSLIEFFYYSTSIKHIQKFIFKDLKEKPKLIILYDYPALATLNLYFFCKKNKIKLISDCSEWYKPHGKMFFWLFKLFDIQLRMRFLLHRLDGIIVISKYLFNYYQKRIDPIVIIPPVVDCGEMKWRYNNSKTRDYVQLIYAGSPGQGDKDIFNNLILALEIVIKENRKVKLQIVGITENEFYETKNSITIPETIKGNIEFLGRVSHLKSLNLISESDFSIFVRKNNVVTKAGFPTKFVESITCGTPLLTNKSSNLDDFLIEGKNGYWLIIDSPNSLAKSLIYAVNTSREKINEMKKYCSNSNLFHYEKFEIPFKNFIKTIIT